MIRILIKIKRNSCFPLFGGNINNNASPGRLPLLEAVRASYHCTSETERDALLQLLADEYPTDYPLGRMNEFIKIFELAYAESHRGERDHPLLEMFQSGWMLACMECNVTTSATVTERFFLRSHILPLHHYTSWLEPIFNLHGAAKCTSEQCQGRETLRKKVFTRFPPITVIRLPEGYEVLMEIRFVAH